MENKIWYKSWTIWFNLVVIVLDAINAVAGIIPIPAGVMSYVTTIGNLLLRFKTTKPLGWRKES